MRGMCWLGHPSPPTLSSSKHARGSEDKEAPINTPRKPLESIGFESMG